MIEIVFSDSACGSLKVAQHYGKGDYKGGSIGVIIIKNDGSEPTSEEQRDAQNVAEEKTRLEWEEGTPMGGNPKDVFGFNLMLSIGDISKNDFAKKRRETIDALWSIYPDDPSDPPCDFTDKLQEMLKTVCTRAANGEDIRIWYSNQPDELCGLYWFMAELSQLDSQLGTVYIVKLPEHEYCDNNTVISHSSWGEISPGNWWRYTAIAEVATSAFRQHCAAQWNYLQEENALLRAMLNGRLLGVSETIYDHFIYQEIAKESDEFQEVMIVGSVLGKYKLGIGDAWIARRIEKMINDGKLKAVSAPTRNMPVYHRRLKKTYLF